MEIYGSKIPNPYISDNDNIDDAFAFYEKDMDDQNITDITRMMDYLIHFLNFVIIGDIISKRKLMVPTVFIMD